ncbi:MAG: hypothetical protein QM679_04180 [Patulibacter sp.]
MSGKMIQVRDVPEQVHRTLKVRAAAEGMSLSDYIKRDLVRAAEQPTLAELAGRVEARGRTGLHRETVLASLDELRGT